MRLTARKLMLGYIERHGCVTISHENGCYHIKRHPDQGWEHRTCRTLREARAIASRLTRV